MATLQNIGKLKYRGKDGQWHDLPVVVQNADGSVSTISGKGAPTSATQGKVNQLYRDEDTQKLYICTATDGGYTWAAVSGGSVDVDATLTKAGYAADAKAAGDAIGRKLDATALPTAVNDALAQAKASGEFDGAKGDKGDTGPEGPKGDTGPIGPKGADGKDGAGMDVTGAKVGQIAKITAVDSAGKPTEWEPVDMPSGGNTMDFTWEHIRDVELTSETIEAIVSTTDAGDAFSYDEILMEFIPNLSGYFYVRANKNANNSANVQVWAENTKYHQMHLSLLNKKLAITGVFRTNGSIGFANNYKGNIDLDKITMLVFGASSSVNATFTVKIWGR